MSLFADYVKFCANVGFKNSKEDLNFQGQLYYAELQNKNLYGNFTNKKNFLRRDLKVGTNVKELWK